MHTYITYTHTFTYITYITHTYDITLHYTTLHYITLQYITLCLDFVLRAYLLRLIDLTVVRQCTQLYPKDESLVTLSHKWQQGESMHEHSCCTRLRVPILSMHIKTCTCTNRRRHVKHSPTNRAAGWSGRAVRRRMTRRNIRVMTQVSITKPDKIVKILFEQRLRCRSHP